MMREAVFVSTARTPLTKAHRGEFNITPGPTLAAWDHAHLIGHDKLAGGEGVFVHEGKCGIAHLSEFA
jgi:hypothetical protein